MSLEYTFSLTDKLSAGLQKIVTNNDRMLSTFGGVQTKMMDANHTFSNTAKSIGALKKQVAALQEEREWLPAGNTSAILGCNNEIKKLNGEIQQLENLKDVPWTEQLESVIPGLEKMFNPMNMLSSAATHLKQAVNDGLAAWQSQYEEQSRLSAVMHNTMNAGEGEVKSILKLTDAQQKLGVVSQSMQITGAQSLAGSVKQHDSLKRMIPLMNDMLAQQYGTSASQKNATEIASAFGKVIQGDTGALSQYGIRLTEAQETLLRFGNEAERVATLQEVVGKAAGGANQALAQTPEGRWAQHENGISALLGRIGKLTVQFRNSLFPVINTFSSLFEKLVGWIESNSTTIAAAINTICRVAAPVLEVFFSLISGIKESFSWWFSTLMEGNPLIVVITANITGLVTTLGGLYAISKAVTFCQNVQAGATRLLTIAQSGLNSAFLTSPLTWIVLAIGAVVAIVMICWNKFEGFRRVVLVVWNVMQEFGNGLIKAIIYPIKQIINGIGTLGQAISQLFAGDFDGAWESASKGAKELADGIINGNPLMVGLNVVKNGDWAGAVAKGELEAMNTGGNDGFGMSDISDMLNFSAFTGSNPDIQSFLPELTMSSPVQPIALPAPLPIQTATLPKELTQADDSQSNNFLEDIMLNVRKIAAVVALPLALSAQPTMELSSTSQFDTHQAGMTESYLSDNQGAEGRTINIDRICEQIVIHVANTDHQGTEEIRSAIYEVLNEIAEA